MSQNPLGTVPMHDDSRRIPKPWMFFVVALAVSRRVGQGGYPPRPPTDPDVRDSRIRLVRLWIRYPDGDLVNDSGVGQWVPAQKVMKVGPTLLSFLRSATQPVPPNTFDFISEAR